LRRFGDDLSGFRDNKPTAVTDSLMNRRTALQTDGCTWCGVIRPAVGPQDLELAAEDVEESAAHLQCPRRRGVGTQLEKIAINTSHGAVHFRFNLNQVIYR